VSNAVDWESQVSRRYNIREIEHDYRDGQGVQVGSNTFAGLVLQDGHNSMG
jgi:hypothetical protein